MNSSESYNYPPDWDQRRRHVYDRDGYTCQNCGAQGAPYGDAELHVHHVVGVSSGGTHEPSNLVTLCADCHTATHNASITAPTAERATLSPAASSRSGSTWSQRNGWWWIHALLLVFTIGLGNIPYWWWSRRNASPTGSVSASEWMGLLRWIGWLVAFVVAVILLGITVVIGIVAIGYAGYAVAMNRHDAFDRLQASEATRLPGLDRDEPDRRVGVMTSLYLLALLAVLSLLLLLL